MIGRVRFAIASGQPLFRQVVDFNLQLPVRRFVVIALDALHRDAHLVGPGWHAKHLCSRDRRGGGVHAAIDVLQQILGFAIVRTPLQFFAQLRRRSGIVAALVERDRQVKAVIRIAGIGVHRFGEIRDRGSPSPATGIHHAQVVVHLGERQPGGKEAEGGIGLVVIAAIKLGHAEQKVGLAGYRVVLGDAAQPRSRRLVLVSIVVEPAQLQHGQRVVRVQPDRLAKVSNLLRPVGREDAANVVLEGVEPDRLGCLQELRACQSRRRW